MGRAQTVAMKALKQLLEVTSNIEQWGLERFALPFWREMEVFIASHAKSESRPKELGKGLLFALCERQVYMEDAIPLLENLLSLKISLDVKNSEEESPFDVCKSVGTWNIYEKLNLSVMGESLRG